MSYIFTHLKLQLQAGTNLNKIILVKCWWTVTRPGHDLIYPIISQQGESVVHARKVKWI